MSFKIEYWEEARHESTDSQSVVLKKNTSWLFTKCVRYYCGANVFESTCAAKVDVQYSGCEQNCTLNTITACPRPRSETMGTAKLIHSLCRVLLKIVVEYNNTFGAIQS